MKLENCSFNTIFLRMLRAMLVLNDTNNNMGWHNLRRDIKNSFGTEIEPLISGEKSNLLLNKILLSKLIANSFEFLESTEKTLVDLTNEAFSQDTSSEKTTISFKTKQYLIINLLLSLLILFSDDISSGEAKVLSYKSIMKEIQDSNMFNFPLGEKKNELDHLFHTYFNLK